MNTTAKIVFARLRQVRRADRSVETTHVWDPEPAPPSFTFEHDKQERLFVLTWSDGKTERFRDNPRGTWWSRLIPKLARCGR